MTVLKETSQVKHVVLCAPGFPVSADDPHKPFLLDHALALTAAGIKVTVVCPWHPDAPLRQTITQPNTQPSDVLGPALDSTAIEIVRVRFAPSAIARRIARGDSYRQFSGVAAIWVLPLLLRLSWTTARHARRSGAQVVHGHWWFPAGLAAVLAGRAVRHARSVVHVHGTDIALVSGPISRWTARRTLRAAHGVAAVSQQLAEAVQEIGGGSAAVVPMPLPAIGSAVKTSTEDGPLLAVGRLVPEKGFDVLIDAVAHLRSEPAALAPTQPKPAQSKPAQSKLVIVGEGPERGRLFAQADRLGVELELVGEVAPSKLWDYYDQARLVVVPSRREGFGMTIAHALAAGRAVVASEVGTAAELIEPGVSGLLVAPDDPIALAQALAQAQPTWGDSGPARVGHLSTISHAAAMQACYL